MGTGLPCEVTETFWNQTVVRVAQGCEDPGSTPWVVCFKTVDFMGCDYIATKRRCFQDFRRWLSPACTLVGGVRGSLGAADLCDWSLSRPTEAALWSACVCFLGPGAAWYMMGRSGIVPRDPSFPVRGPF